jgi:isochorismate synthase
MVSIRWLERGLPVRADLPLTRLGSLVPAMRGVDRGAESPHAMSSPSDRRLDGLGAAAGAVAAWSDADGFEFLALGEVARVEGMGPDRFEMCRSGMAQYDFEPSPRPGVPGREPFWVGGFAFAPADGRRAGPWKGFGDAVFVLPRILIIRRPGDGWRLYVASRAGEGEAVLSKVADEAVGAVVATLRADVSAVRDNGESTRAWAREPSIGAPAASEAGETKTRSGSPPVGGEITPDPAPLVRAARSRLSPTGIRKVVVAVRGVWPRPGGTRPWTVFCRLRAAEPSAFAFLFSPGAGSWLVGATPERLVRIDDGGVSSLALAGSAPRGETVEQDGANGRALLASGKDREEHAFVVAAVREALERLVGDPAAVESPPTPQLRRLRRIQHLETPLRAPWGASKHLLEAASELHPTPALAGFPQAAATAVIADLEGQDRGWYGGAVGWCDSRGHGELAVVIRSVLLAPDRLVAYAGAGIVAASRVDGEVAEIRLKLDATVGAALGEVPAS